jgi:hypothetical protein
VRVTRWPATFHVERGIVGEAATEALTDVEGEGDTDSTDGASDASAADRDPSLAPHAPKASTHPAASTDHPNKPVTPDPRMAKIYAARLFIAP